MKKITGMTTAWLSYATDATEFSNLAFSSCDMSDHGWVKVGDASVTVTLLDYKDVVTGQIDMLNEAKKRVQAEAEKKLTEIEGQIQSLLAIEYKPLAT